MSNIQTTTFKGARYIPKFYGEWVQTESYEAIGVVKHNAFTYISKQPVPPGIEITNTDFWLLWADPNAQMEELRQIFMSYVGTVEDLSDVVDTLNGEMEQVNTTLDEIDETLTATNDKIVYDISPNIIGCDYAYYDAGNDNTHFSAVCEHNGVYYGVFPTGVTTGADAGLAYLKLYDENTNTIVDKGSAQTYHSNSICYNDNNDRVYLASDNGNVTIFDHSFEILDTISLPNNINLWSISFDSISNKLYGMTNVNYSEGYADIIELDENTLSVINTYRINFEIFDGYLIQDMAIDNGLVYLSIPNGYFVVIELSENKIENIGHVSNIDSTNARRMGELEGWEFNSNSELVCGYNMTKGNCAIGHTAKIFHKKNIHQTKWYTYNDTVNLNSEYRNIWYLNENQIKCLTELLTWNTPYVGKVQVYGNVPISTAQYQIIIGDLELRVMNGATLTTREIRQLKGDLTLYLEQNATIHFATRGSAGVRMDVGCGCRFTLNALANSSIVHDSSETNATIQCGYNKNPVVIGNLNDNTVTLDNTTNLATTNTIYLGAGYKIQATS